LYLYFESEEPEPCHGIWWTLTLFSSELAEVGERPTATVPSAPARSHPPGKTFHTEVVAGNAKDSRHHSGKNLFTRPPAPPQQSVSIRLNCITLIRGRRSSGDGKWAAYVEFGIALCALLQCCLAGRVAENERGMHRVYYVSGVAERLSGEISKCRGGRRNREQWDVSRYIWKSLQHGLYHNCGGTRSKPHKSITRDHTKSGLGCLFWPLWYPTKCNARRSTENYFSDMDLAIDAPAFRRTLWALHTSRQQFYLESDPDTRILFRETTSQWPGT
jgi:hypothetical protein